VRRRLPVAFAGWRNTSGRRASSLIPLLMAIEVGNYGLD
jgi:hypothetical protein